MPVSAHALRHIMGLVNMAPEETDRVSQGMLDGCANHGGGPAVEACCHDCTASIDRHIDAQVEEGGAHPLSAPVVQREAGLPMGSERANLKLVISGGQNEPRDAIAVTLRALPTRSRRCARAAGRSPTPPPSAPAGSAPSACHLARWRGPTTPWACAWSRASACS